MFVAGTTARGSDLDGDAYVQTEGALSIIRQALSEIGADLRDVVRTVVYLTDMADEPFVARAHGNTFGKIRPASTLVQVAGLTPPAARVEIEVTAVTSENASVAGLSAIQALNYTIVRVRDMQAMRTFYGRTLRFQFGRELSPDWVEYRLGPNILALASSFLYVENQTLDSGVTALQLAFQVPYESVDVCAAELSAAGVILLSPPTDQIWRHRTLFFCDPDGNLIEIYADL